MAVEAATSLLESEAPAVTPGLTLGNSANLRRWAPWLVGFYAVGVATMLARLVASVAISERLRRMACPVVTGPAASALQGLAKKWSMGAAPVLAQSQQILVPSLVGLVKPTILVPASALVGLSSSDLEMILAHELAHLRRRDLWVNVLQRLAEAVLFFNPALWHLSRRIGALREYCCDELACEGPAAAGTTLRLNYATALLRTIELAHPRAEAQARLTALAASGRSPSELRRRIARLLGEPLREPLTVTRGGLLFGGALVLAVLAPPAWLHSQPPAAETPPLPLYPPARTEADDAVAQAREKTFGLKLVPRILLRQRVTSGTIAGMEKWPERSLKTMFQACGKDYDPAAWTGHTDVTLAWTLRQLLVSTERGAEAQNDYQQSYLWDGENGWICEEAVQGRRLYRYASVETLFDSFASTAVVYLPQLGAAGGRLPWGGEKITLDEHASAPELTRYKLAGTETVDGVACDVYEGPQRMERLWIEKSTGLVKAASRSYMQQSLPNYFQDLVREAAGRTFVDQSEYAGWIAAQPTDVQERVGAHWSAAHWPTSEPGNLTVFSDYREIAPGVHWPMHCERIVVHREGQNGYKYYRNAIDVTEVTRDFRIEDVIRDILPREGDMVTDRRFAPDEPEFIYVWKPGDDASEAARQEALDRKRQAGEAKRKVNEAPINSVEDAIAILTDGPNTDPTMVWARAIKYLVDHQEAALPAVVKQLDAETRDHPISKLAFTLRAIGDPRAVPALIRALPRTLLPVRSDYGLRLEEDLELLRFMQRHDKVGRVRGDAQGMFDYGRAFREVASALQRLTNEDFGEMELNRVFAANSPAQLELQKIQFDRIARRWAEWWESEGKSLVDDPAYASVNLPARGPAQPQFTGRREPPAGPGVRFQDGRSNWVVPSVQDSNQAAFIDLDTMREGSWPASLPPVEECGVDSPELLAWARKEGFDVMGVTTTPPGESEPLYCLQPLEMHVWKITPQQHRDLPEAMAGREAYPRSQPVDVMVPQREIKPPYDYEFGGDSFLFVTREGTAGVLRMTAQVTDPNVGGGYYSLDDQFRPTGFRRGAKVSVATMAEGDAAP